MSTKSGPYQEKYQTKRHIYGDGESKRIKIKVFCIVLVLISNSLCALRLYYCLVCDSFHWQSCRGLLALLARAHGQNTERKRFRRLVVRCIILKSLTATLTCQISCPLPRWHCMLACVNTSLSSFLSSSEAHAEGLRLNGRAFVVQGYREASS